MRDRAGYDGFITRPILQIYLHIGRIIILLLPAPFHKGIAMKLSSRHHEQKLLEHIYKSKRPEFLALYGRRRVGKTFLIKAFFETKECVFFHVTGIKDGSLTEQLEHFVKVTSITFHKGSEIKARTRWIDAFDGLTDAIQKHAESHQKIILFFDEFPWMAVPKSKLLQALDHYWNHYWSNDVRIKLVICGSSASWIINKIINNHGGLHNRITQRILLKPYTLSETKKFLSQQGVKLSHRQITQIYMLTGGIPFYLSFVKKGRSSAQVIENLVFSENAPLLKEFDNLFSSLFEDPEPYIDLLRIIAKNRYGVAQTEIAEKSKYFTRGGHISEKLKELDETGFIIEFVPHQHKKKGVYYRVIDEYVLFYLYWIEPIRKKLQKVFVPEGYWQTLQAKASWHSWSGYAFEAIIYKHLGPVRKKLHIPVTAIADSWRYFPMNKDQAGAQIDLLFDRDDDMITLCEIKFSVKPFVIDKKYAVELIRKQSVFVKKTRTKKQIMISMITAEGLSDTLYADDLIQGVVTLDDLFL